MFYISCQTPLGLVTKMPEPLSELVSLNSTPWVLKPSQSLYCPSSIQLSSFWLTPWEQKNNSFTNTYCLQLFAGCSLLTTFGVFVNALKTCCLQYCHLCGDLTSWLDHAKEKNGGCYSELQVEETKCFLTLLPLIIFQLLYKMCIMQVRKGN